MSLRSRLGVFVLTGQEQRTIAFIILMLVLGLATIHYRRTHSPKAETVPGTTEAKSAVSPSPSVVQVPHR